MQLIRKLLFPISLLYGLIVFFRNRLYDMGVFSSKTFAVKTICVGNLSVGGTGKTPMIELLVRELGESFRVAILSRGYKRKTKGFLLAGNHTSVEELGDEPFQLKKKFPKKNYLKNKFNLNPKTLSIFEEDSSLIVSTLMRI